jgi:hypothetical protein
MALSFFNELFYYFSVGGDAVIMEGDFVFGSSVYLDIAYLNILNSFGSPI